MPSDVTLSSAEPANRVEIRGIGGKDHNGRPARCCLAKTGAREEQAYQRMGQIVQLESLSRYVWQACCFGSKHAEHRWAGRGYRRRAFLGGIAALTASSPLTAQNNAPDSNGMIYRARSAARPSIALRDGYRKRVFLMTKFDGRTKKAAAQQIDESLKRLQTDHVDLLRFHENIRMEDPDEFFSSGGAVEALMDAKRAGKTRYIGFTGQQGPGGASTHASAGESA
jgi:hypothetical protein